MKDMTDLDSRAVEVTDVIKSFRRQPALQGVNLSLRRGEIYGLLGPNGSGKTTLIRCVLGLVRPDAGNVQVLGRRMPDRRVLSRIGYMTQAPALYPDLSVQENLRFFAAVNGADANVTEALRFVDLEDRADSVVATLSGGMRTRASLACAIVHRPELLLLDEPTVGLDPQLRARLWDQFQKMADGGTTILVSSHVMDEAERCQRLGLIRFGRLLAEGTVESLKEQAGVERLEDAFLKLSAMGAQ
jgi:ABC-2 type transport system ATP-binding protein